MSSYKVDGILKNETYEQEKAVFVELKKKSILGFSILNNFELSKTKLFIIKRDSDIAKKIFTTTDSVIDINDDDFKESKIDVNGEMRFAMIHNELIKAINQTLETELENVINECVLRHHTEMYFSMILGYMISSEYNLQQEKTDLNDIYENYKKTCAVLLMDICNVNIPEFYKVKSDEINNIRLKYADMCEHGKLYSKVISTYVIRRDHIQNIISNILNEKGPIYSNFYQKCMIKGFEIANNRILKNIDSKDYFGHEIVETKDSKVLKFYVTIYGLIHRKDIIELANKGLINDLIDNYLLKHEIARISDSFLEKQLETNFIFKVKNEDKLFFYKRRDQDGEYAPFGEQDRRSAIHALIGQSQFNLTQLQD